MEPADLVTWTTLLGFAIALFGYLATMKRDPRRDLGATMDARFAQAEAANAARFAGIDHRFDAAEARSEALEKSMNAQFAAMGQRIDDVNNRIDDTNARLDDLNARVGEVREELRTSNAAMRAELSMVEQRTFDLGLNQQPRAG